jgi:nitrate/nitrite transport system ATP-binding protein
MGAFIDIQGISKSFHTPTSRREVLDRVTLSIDRGEFVSIVGPMGAGKTTLLNIVAGLTAPDGGRVTIAGEPVDGIRRDAALVFQNYSLLPWFSALENVRLAVQAALPTRSRGEQLAQARRTLELVGLGGSMTRRPSQLSGGMRQRVAIARAFAIEPTILFLDEPFGALDALTRGTLQQELAKLCSFPLALGPHPQRELTPMPHLGVARPRLGMAAGAAHGPVTTLMITNNVDEAILLSDRIVPMTRGPRATLGSSIAVDLARPRNAALLTHDPGALRVRATVVEALTAGFGRAVTRPRGELPAVARSLTAAEARMEP